MSSEDHQARFGGVARLYGEEAASRFARSHVCIAGIGGVGSWAAEALARSGIGTLTLIDLDDICLSNINRQLHALGSTVGQFKVDVMAERVRAIHPAIEVHALRKYLTMENLEPLLDDRFDVVLDAIDYGKLKCRVLHHCRELGIKAVTAGGAGGLRDPTQIRCTDLARSFNDPLLHQVRRHLRQRYDWPRNGKRFGVPCVFSEEEPKYLTEPVGDAPRGINCNTGLGTSAAVTGAFGLAAAAAVLELLAADPDPSHAPPPA